MSHDADLIFRDRDIEITLYKQPQSNNWYARFQWDKKQKRFSCLTSEVRGAKEHCYKILEVLRGDKEEGITRKTAINESRMTFRQLFDSFVKYKESNRIVSKTTIRDYHARGKNLLNWCGDWVVEDEFKKYESDIYGHYINHRNNNRQQYQIIMKNGEASNGKKLPETLSGKTINSECILLHTILSYAKYDIGLLRNWSIPKYSHHRLPESTDITCPTRHEYKLMKNYWITKIDDNGKKDHYRPILNLYMRLNTNIGARPIEMNNLKLSDIDFKQKILTIRDRKQKLRSSTKDSLITSFPITDRIQPFLEKIIEITKETREILKSSKNSEDRKSSEYLFLDPDTNKRLGDFKKSWSTMLIRLGLSKDYTPKTLRKIFITKMVKQSSIPLSIIATLVGHTNTTTLQKHYLHLRPDDLRRALVHVYQEIDEKNKKQKIRIESKYKSNKNYKKAL